MTCCCALAYNSTHPRKWSLESPYHLRVGTAEQERQVGTNTNSISRSFVPKKMRLPKEDNHNRWFTIEKERSNFKVAIDPLSSFEDDDVDDDLDEEDQQEDSVVDVEEAPSSRYSPLESFQSNVFRDQGVVNNTKSGEEFWISNVWDPTPSLAAEMMSGTFRDDEEDNNTFFSSGTYAFNSNQTSFTTAFSSDWSYRAAPGLSSWGVQDEAEDESRRARAMEKAAMAKRNSERHIERFDPFAVDEEEPPSLRRTMSKPLPVIRIIKKTKPVKQGPATVKDLEDWRDQFKLKTDEPLFYSLPKELATPAQSHQTDRRYCDVEDDATFSCQTYDPSLAPSVDDDDYSLRSCSKVTTFSAMKKKNRLQPFKDCVKFLVN